MFRVLLILAIALYSLSGCTSSSVLMNKANNHNKAASYYQSIGQPVPAQQEHSSAEQAQKDANELWPVLVDIYNLFNEKDH